MSSYLLQPGYGGFSSFRHLLHADPSCFILPYHAPGDEPPIVLERLNHAGALAAGLVEPRSDKGFDPRLKRVHDDPENTTVFIGGLHEEVSGWILERIFGVFGETGRIMVHPKAGIAFLRFTEKVNAVKAIVRMQGFQLGMIELRLDWGNNPSQHKLTGPFHPLPSQSPMRGLAPQYPPHHAPAPLQRTSTLNPVAAPFRPSSAHSPADHEGDLPPQPQRQASDSTISAPITQPITPPASQLPVAPPATPTDPTDRTPSPVDPDYDYKLFDAFGYTLSGIACRGLKGNDVRVAECRRTDKTRWIKWALV